MRKIVKVLSAVVVLFVVGGLTSAAVPARSSARAGSGFWAVTVPGESFAGTAHKAAGASGSVAPTIKGMIKRVKKGHTVLIPEGTRQGVHFVPATVAKLQAALAAAGATTAQPGAEVAGRLSAPGPDPHEFPIRGQGCHQVTWRKERYWAAWCKMPFEIVGEYCDIDGCKKTDTLKTRLKVNPGAKESRVSWSSTYTYQAHHRNFKHIHIEWWVLCFKDEKECGTGNTKELYGNSSGTFTPTSNRLLRNSRIRHAFILWAYFQPDGHWHSDEAKTWKGICKPKPSRQCLYPA